MLQLVEGNRRQLLLSEILLENVGADCAVQLIVLMEPHNKRLSLQI